MMKNSEYMNHNNNNSIDYNVDENGNRKELIEEVDKYLLKMLNEKKKICCGKNERKQFRKN